MKFRRPRFNLILAGRLVWWLPLLLIAVGSCQTAEGKKKKELTSLRLHLETVDTNTNRSEQIIVSQDPLIQMRIEKAPFLTEADVKAAKVIEVIGGFALRLEFARRGSWLLEQFTAGNVGKHVAIYAQFTDASTGKLNRGRWLAAPVNSRRIADGVLVFTPRATRDETERIALGLNNVSRKLKTASEW